MPRCLFREYSMFQGVGYMNRESCRVEDYVLAHWTEFFKPMWFILPQHKNSSYFTCKRCYPENIEVKKNWTSSDAIDLTLTFLSRLRNLNSVTFNSLSDRVEVESDSFESPTVPCILSLFSLLRSLYTITISHSHPVPSSNIGEAEQNFCISVP